jgi:DNA-binding MarR family transcriptional regulator
VFRLNGRLLDIADRITEGTRLSAARWQVLGAVLPGPLTVASVARSMGLTRQSVQRLADVLADEGLCEYRENPAHRRAKLLAPTARGWEAIEKIHPIQVAWADRVGAIVGPRALRAVNATLDTLLSTLDSPAGDVVAPPTSGSSPQKASRR